MFFFSGKPEIDDEFRALVTLSTPHFGSNMARWAASLSALASHLTSRIPEDQRGKFGEAFNKILNFIQSAGVRELLPGSEALRSIEAFKPDLNYMFSAGGTKPALFEMYGIEVPHALEKIIPEKLFPDEMKDGVGDGLVSLKSSVMPYSAEHLESPANHAGIIVDPALRKTVAERIGKVLETHANKIMRGA